MGQIEQEAQNKINALYAKLFPKVRAMYGLSADAFGALIGAEPGMYAKYESGEEVPPIHVVMLFSVGLVTADILIRLSNDPDYIAYCRYRDQVALELMNEQIRAERELTTKEARNNRILTLHQSGDSLTDIARITNLSPQRVHQILKEQKPDEDNNQ